jgi:glycyl-tRNA synthetase alpha chain
MYIQNKNNVYDLEWNSFGVKYGDVFLQAEKEFSAYNFEHANTDSLLEQFNKVEQESKDLVEKKLCLPAYDQCLKASHLFNLLDARGVISVTERANYINKIRILAKACGELWIEKQ